MTKAYNASQPRDPQGTSTGGRWTGSSAAVAAARRAAGVRKFGGGDVYHGTSLAAAKKIATEGIQPNRGKVFFTESPSTLESSGPDIVHVQASLPADLRDQVQFDLEDFKTYAAEENWFIERAIPPSAIYAYWVNGTRYTPAQFKSKFMKDTS